MAVRYAYIARVPVEQIVADLNVTRTDIALVVDTDNIERGMDLHLDDIAKMYTMLKATNEENTRLRAIVTRLQEELGHAGHRSNPTL